jgi:hypothetical protein
MTELGTHISPVERSTGPTLSGSGSTTESAADLDPNSYGPTPKPSEPEESAERAADTRAIDDAVVSNAGARTQAAGCVIVELSNGTRLLICPV